jgi:hypothetical protein
MALHMCGPIVVVTIFLMICSVINGFVTNHHAIATNLGTNSKQSFARLAAELNDLDNMIDVTDESSRYNTKPIIVTVGKASISAASVWVATAQVVLADSPDWGLFEGRIGSLLHPVAMGSMFVLSIYTAYLGFQWRRQRTIGDEISTLKKSLPNLDGAGSVSAALVAAKEVNDLYKINSISNAAAMLSRQR